MENKTKPKFTPGPWHLIETTNLRNPDVSAYLLANKTPYVHGILDSCNPQDAALIAAAPELFEAVATIRSMQGLKECLEQKYSKALVSDLLEQLDKAIAKARGGS